MRIAFLILVVAVVVAPSPAAVVVSPLVVGEGENQSYLHVEFDDGALYVFDVRYEEDSVTTKQMMEAVAAETTLTYTTQFGGYTLYGVTYDGHHYEDWDHGFWSLWYRDTETVEWVYSPAGWAVMRASDGEWHGLVADPGFTYSASPTDVELGLPGDANGDGLVSDADYTIWADHYGQTVSGPAGGDFNGDSLVSDADYTIWADHYGASSGAVPEPMALAVCLLAWPHFLRLRGRKA
jgi:hypothetical protein